MDTISPKQRKMVMAGCLCLMLAISSYGLSLSTIQGPILRSLGGIDYFSQITVLSSIAICVMTPIGGRLCDMIGGSKLILIFGILSVISGLLLSFVPVLGVFLVFRVVLAAAQGAYASLPYILVRQIYPAKETPKAIGYLTMMMAIGSLIGSYLAGFLEGAGLMSIAMAFPLIPLAVAIPLIYKNLDSKPTIPFKLDWPGIILLTISLAGILMGLNNGPTVGWFSMQILLDFAVGIIALIGFIYWENRASVPVIPMRMFRMKEYSLLMIIAFCLMFYMNGMNVYIPKAVQDILQAGSAASGALQIPRTIMTMILPSFCGAWVVKHYSNIWKGLTISGIFVIIPFALLIFIGPKMPVWFIMAVLALTGVADSFRSVSLLPAVQNIVEPQDIGVATSMIGFMSTLSGSIASAFFGLAYDSLTKATAGIRGMINGTDTICLITTVVAIIGTLLIVLFFRPMFLEGLKKAEDKTNKNKKTPKTGTPKKVAHSAA